MIGTMAVNGIIPIGEYLRDYNKEAKTYTRRQFKQYNKIRESIIEKTLQMTEKELQDKKKFSDKINSLSDADRIKFLEDNALAAQKAKINNIKGALLGTFSIALMAAGLTIPLLGVNAIAANIISTSTSALSLYTGYRGIKLAVKGRRGLNSDAMLKSDDFKKAFDPVWEQYLAIQEELEKHKDVLLEKEKTLSKKDFKEYVNQYTQHVIDIVAEKKAQQEREQESNKNNDALVPNTEKAISAGEPENQQNVTNQNKEPTQS